jgi:hypothetical protein
MQKFQTFTARQYLMIDIANNFGLDKKNWDDRLAWFKENEHCLMDLVKQAETPALYYAGVKAWEAVQRGEPIGYLISLDATASGFQCLAALTGDHSAAQLCNVVDTGKREDAYTVVYNFMMSVLGEDSKIDRADTKQAIMTALYGSKAQPKKVFGTGKLLKTFYAVMNHLAPAAWKLNEAFLAMWNPQALINSWVLPDNFHVHVKVMNQEEETVHFLNKPYTTFRTVNAPKEDGRSLGANCIHSADALIVREIARRCDHDPAQVQYLYEVLETYSEHPAEEDNISLKMVETLWQHYLDSGYLSARIMDYLHADTVHLVDREVVKELLDSLPKKPFKVLSIHDCWRCLPAYGNDIRWQYNNQLMLIAKSNLLQFLLSQIMGKEIKITKQDPDLWKSIMESNYSLS